MEQAPSLSPELAAALRRYLELQQAEQRLRAEKAALQEQLAGHMAGQRLTYWYPVLDGQPLKVRSVATAVVEYDEAALRARLGPRYTAILAPDLKKLRRHLPELGAALAPVLDLVGAPAPDRVKAAIAQGLVRAEDFAGAFTKTVKRQFAVSRVQPDAPATSRPPEPEQYA